MPIEPYINEVIRARCESMITEITIITKNWTFLNEKAFVKKTTRNNLLHAWQLNLFQQINRLRLNPSDKLKFG